MSVIDHAAITEEACRLMSANPGSDEADCATILLGTLELGRGADFMAGCFMMNRARVRRWFRNWRENELWDGANIIDDPDLSLASERGAITFILYVLVGLGRVATTERAEG